MAPRKTTKTAADTPAEQADLEKAAAAIGQLASMGSALPTLDIDGMSREQFEQEQRFQVALAILPAMYPYVGSDECLADENRAGATARLAFEYADAFIAHSKKGKCDGE